MKSKIILALLILFTFLCQCTLMDLLSIGSISPNLIVVLVVSMGLLRGRKSGLWVGFFCGLLTDLFFGSLFGFYALVYMYAGYFSGYAHQFFYDDDLKVPAVLCALTDLGLSLAIYGMQFLLRGRLGFTVYLCRIILPEVFYTTLVSLIVYRPLRTLHVHFMRSEWKESDSIWLIK